MYKIIYKHTLLIALLFSLLETPAQKKFDLEIKNVSFQVEDQYLVGHSTSFEFSREEVRKGWWRYAKKFGNPTDMRTHYQVVVPAEITDGNVDITVYTQVESMNDRFEFRIASANADYKSQLQKILVEFKIQFYIRHYLDRLEALEEATSNASDDYTAEDDTERRRTLLMNIQNKKREMDRLLVAMKQIERTVR